MNFNFRSIGDKKSKKKLAANFFIPLKRLVLSKKVPPRKFNIALAITLAFLGIYLVARIFIGIYNFASDSLLSILSFGNSLAVDDFGQTNILILGVGGAGHSGEDLTDTMIVASVNSEKKNVVMLSLPRDLFVQVPELSGGYRINKIYELAKNKYGSRTGLQILAKAVENVVDVPIHYYVKIDFKAFKKIIDAVGGITVTVKNEINDPFYPDKKLEGYEPFHLLAGRQDLDGEIALKYARSRKSTSDFDRSARQQEVLKALREKLLSLQVLTSPSKIKQLYDALAENIETNFSFREILNLTALAQKIKDQKIQDFVLNNSCSYYNAPCLTGGFLYNPQRDLYGGAYVLLPENDDYEKIHRFTHLIFRNNEFLEGTQTVEILNGVGRAGLADSVQSKLSIYGIPITRLGNTIDKEKFDKTTYFVRDEEKSTQFLQILQKIIPGEIFIGESPYLNRGMDIVIVTGQDFLKNIK